MSEYLTEQEKKDTINFVNAIEKGRTLDYIMELRQENEKLKARWDKLKEFVEEHKIGRVMNNDYQLGEYDSFDKVIRNMKKLEKPNTSRNVR